MEPIAGRKEEIAEMSNLLASPRSEFLAVYGRRRVGKTFLIREVYKKDMVFQITGIAHVNMAHQLANFFTAFREANNRNTPELQPPANWFEAFELLRHWLQRGRQKKKVIFFDELPWIDTPRSNFLPALEHFWNSWASARTDIILVVCGSAASWMLNKLIHNKGGLHNRITKRIPLSPFTLHETEDFFRLRNIDLDRYQIIQLYMAMGGIPYYLNEIRPGVSAFQAIDKLCFTKGGLLTFEYDNLFSSLFENAERHTAIVEALATSPRGLIRPDIIAKTGLPDGGGLTRMLEELEESGFIARALPFEKKIRSGIYRLTDQYSLFYWHFIKEKKASGTGSWVSRLDSPSWRSWSGYAFENICHLHIAQVKKALGISGVYSETSSWVDRDREVQIDMLIDRRDHVISVCEVKFSTGIYTIDRNYKAALERKINVFKENTGTSKTVFLAMITTFGVKANIHSTGLIQNEIKMDDLFAARFFLWNNTLSSSY